MADYEIRFTDFVNKGSITVEDTDINNTDTDLTLVGRNYTGYGTAINTNFLQILENFANDTSPESPVEGQLWYDTTDNATQLKVYDGTQWVAAGGLKKASSEPAVTASTIGDLWADTSRQQLYLYTGSGWSLVGPELSTDSSGAISGPRVVDLETTNTPPQLPVTVILNYIKGRVVSIISDTAFTPKVPITGFTSGNPSINPGINVSTAVRAQALGTTTTGRLIGTAEKAESLVSTNGDIIASSQVARINRNNIFTQPQRIESNGGIIIGTANKLTLSIAGSNSEIRNSSSNGSIDFKVNSSGTNSTALRIFNNTYVAIGNASRVPQQALDVQGNIISTGSITSQTSVNVTENVSVGLSLAVGTTLSVAGTSTLANIVPIVDGSQKNIGTSSNRFNNIFATTFTGSFVGNLSGNITGSSASAGRLVSSTTFRLIGDVTADSFTFNGQGALTKTFNTTLSNTFLTNKTAVTSTEATDEILVNRPGTGLRKISQASLVRSIPNNAQGPVMPVGTILPYGGTVPPAGWLLCNGAEVSQGTYSALFTVISKNFGIPAVTGNFKLPDMRGRTLMGWLNGETTGNRVLNDGAAETLGNYGGSERELISSNQIPNHAHSLQGDASTQFYATTSVAGASDSGSTPVTSVGAGDVTGSGIDRTTGIQDYTTQEPFTTVPPFATVGFIIYTGVFS